MSYLIQAFLFVCMGLVGSKAYSGHAVLGEDDAYQSRLAAFAVIFMGIGLVQSVDLPSLISIMGNWTHRGNRGVITGLWSTCQSVGNILGLQLAPVLLSAWDNQWFLLMFLIGAVYLLIAIMMWLLLVPDPSEAGFQMQSEEATWYGAQGRETTELGRSENGRLLH